MTTIILAIVIGAAFGFTLDRIGATNPGLIISMLNFRNLHLMKTILLGIGVASVLTFTGLLLDLIDVGHLSVKATYLGVFAGGILLGTGWAISGYCPGTGVAAAATGRRDAWFFVLGGLLGAAAYMASYAWVASTGILEKIAGGSVTVGKITGADYPALFGNIPGETVGIGVGLLFIIIAALLPDRLIKNPSIHPAP